MVGFTSWLLYCRYQLLYDAGWAPETLWTLVKNTQLCCPTWNQTKILRPSSASGTNSLTEVLLRESGRRKEKGGVHHTSACIGHLLISGQLRNGAPGGRAYSVREVARENICFGLSANPLSPSLCKRLAPGLPLRNFTGQKLSN